MIDHYDGVLFDLDGVIYQGLTPVSEAVQALNKLYDQGMNVGYITNNASRSPEAIEAFLHQLGIHATSKEIINSAVVAVDMLKKHLDPGSTVLVVGTSYLVSVVESAGFRCVRQSYEKPDAVLQGFNPETAWEDLAEAAYALQNKAKWFVTNMDSTIPRENGLAPGNGAFVQAIENTVHTQPLIAGKPEALIFHYAMKRFTMHKPLMVGDRLDTDILGGNQAGIDTALVLTGVNSLKDAHHVPDSSRPTFILKTLEDLFKPPVRFIP